MDVDERTESRKHSQADYNCWTPAQDRALENFLRREEERAMRTTGMMPNTSWLVDCAMSQQVLIWRLVGHRTELGLKRRIRHLRPNPDRIGPPQWTTAQTQALEEFIRREEESEMRTRGKLPNGGWLADRALKELVPTGMVGSHSRKALFDRIRQLRLTAGGVHPSTAVPCGPVSRRRPSKTSSDVRRSPPSARFPTMSSPDKPWHSWCPLDGWVTAARLHCKERSVSSEPTTTWSPTMAGREIRP